MLGTNIGAELLIILTAVPQVYVDFGQPTQRALSAVTLEQVERLYDGGAVSAWKHGARRSKP